MADRFLRHKLTGIVYIWQSPFAQSEDFEECADAAGNPLVDAEDKPTLAAKKAKLKGKKVDAGETPAQAQAEVDAESLDDIDLDFDAALSADASRGLP